MRTSSQGYPAVSTAVRVPRAETGGGSCGCHGIFSFLRCGSTGEDAPWIQGFSYCSWKLGLAHGRTVYPLPRILGESSERRGFFSSGAVTWKCNVLNSGEFDIGACVVQCGHRQRFVGANGQRTDKRNEIVVYSAQYIPRFQNSGYFGRG